MCVFIRDSPCRLSCCSCHTWYNPTLKLQISFAIKVLLSDRHIETYTNRYTTRRVLKHDCWIRQSRRWRYRSCQKTRNMRSWTFSRWPIYYWISRQLYLCCCSHCYSLVDHYYYIRCLRLTLKTFRKCS